MSIPDILYKYRDWKKDTDKRILTHNEIFFASPSRFNDPFDCRIPVQFLDALSQKEVHLCFKKRVKESHPELNRKEQRSEALQSTIRYMKAARDPAKVAASENGQLERIQNQFGIFSMSALKENLLLWAHYSDSHRGFCVGLDSKMLMNHAQRNGFKDPEASTELSRVTYQTDYPTPRYFDKSCPEKTKLLDKALTTKSKDWEYEQEYRLILTNGTNEPLQIPEEAIVSVYLGLEMPQEHRNEILECLRQREHKPLVYQAERKKKAFGLDFKALELDSP